MTGQSGVTLRPGAAFAVAAALLLGGAGAMYLLMPAGAGGGGVGHAPPGEAMQGAPASAPQQPAGPSSATPRGDVVIPLAPEMAQRAGIVTATVSSGMRSAGIRLPGVVEPNAYRLVGVTALVGGRVTRVSAALGDRVRPGQTLADIYSPELAEAHTKYVAARAMLNAHDRELQRTHKLAEIGAASTQELERAHAEHAAQTAAVRSARAQLELLGAAPAALDADPSEDQVSAITSVPAPIDGVVIERAVNAGMNVEPGAKLFTIVDLSTVWIVADVFEQDLARVGVGSGATIATPAYPDLALRGRVSYIDPQVRPETRTARVRVEVANPRRELRLGMYADVVIAGPAAGSAPVVPRKAVQTVGNRTVVYLAGVSAPGTFVEREVRVAGASGDQVEIAEGIRPGDVVVTEGSFFLRAERERLNIRPSAPATAGVGREAPAGAGDDRRTVQAARILVTATGFEPPSVTLRAGSPARLTFVRTTDQTCGTEVVFPSLDIKRALPLNEPVVIEFTPAATGEIAFACGMNMLKGTVVVQ